MDRVWFVTDQTFSCERKSQSSKCPLAKPNAILPAARAMAEHVLNEQRRRVSWRIISPVKRSASVNPAVLQLSAMSVELVPRFMTNSESRGSGSSKDRFWTLVGQIRTVSSLDAVISRFPSGEKATDQISKSCPRSEPISAQERVSHSLMLWSEPVLARMVPSGENTAQTTC